MNTLHRYDFLKLLALGGASFLGLSALPGVSTFAAETKKIGPASPWARLKFFCQGYDPDDWAVQPDGDQNLITTMREQTTANLIRRWNTADVAQLNSMTPYPFLFMHANTRPQLSDADCANLREYLLRGGFLFAEDCIMNPENPSQHDAFFRQMAETNFGKIFPDAKLERLPLDHPIFSCYYRFKQGIPHMQGAPHGLHGITHKGRLVALLSPSDIHCGWCDGGQQWFGREKKIQAMQMGVNIYLYAMTQTGGLITDPAKDAPDLNRIIRNPSRTVTDPHKH